VPLFTQFSPCDNHIATTAGAAAAKLSDVTADPDTLHAADLEIRPAEGLVLAGGRVLMLSVREFRMLVAFAQRAGTVMSRDELYAAVWGGPLRPRDRSVDVYVRKLRVKLGRASPQRRFIHTHQGFGYRFQAEARTVHSPDRVAF
jgi:DNA-binding response OmpR family regulator